MNASLDQEAYEEMAERFAPMNAYEDDAFSTSPGLEWFDEVEPTLTSAYLIKGLLDV